MYPIPVDLTRGKSHVTVKIQALPGMIAGGVFGCRMQKQKNRPMKRYIMTTGLMYICVFCSLAQKQMMYGDTSRIGIPFSKDPHVVEFQGKYLMYYSIPPKQNGNAEAQGWGIGIAGSKNLKDWHRIGEIIPQTAYESKGLCAPGALVRNDTVHLFYQTYGNGAKDAICMHGLKMGSILYVMLQILFFLRKGSGTAGVPSMRRSFFKGSVLFILCNSYS